VRKRCGYVPIAHYGLIGDWRAGGSSGDGSVDFACFPRFDSKAALSRRLDRERGGFFSFTPKKRAHDVAAIHAGHERARARRRASCELPIVMP
jgi:hypothetical protein